VLDALPGLAAMSPKLAGYGAYGVGALGRTATNAIDRLGPLARLAYRPVGTAAFQIGRDSNPYSPPDTAQ
jgi:hypothetical protein